MRKALLTYQLKFKTQLIQRKNLIPNVVGKNIFNTKFEDWGCTKMCVTKDGHIIMSGKIGDENWLKCFNTEGDCLWEIKMGKAEVLKAEVKGLCCLSTTDEYFIVTRQKCIELRNISDGRIVCKRDVDFSCNYVCSTEDAIFVKYCNSNPVKLVLFLCCYQTEPFATRYQGTIWLSYTTSQMVLRYNLAII